MSVDFQKLYYDRKMPMGDRMSVDYAIKYPGKGHKMTNWEVYHQLLNESSYDGEYKQFNPLAPIHQVVKTTIAPGRVEEYRRLMKSDIEHSRNEPGCIRFDFM